MTPEERHQIINLILHMLRLHRAYDKMTQSRKAMADERFEEHLLRIQEIILKGEKC